MNIDTSKLKYKELQKLASREGMPHVVGITRKELEDYINMPEVDQIKFSKKQDTFYRENPRNPTGKGGFQDNPENINTSGRPKNRESFTYWLHEFKNMTVTEFMSWQDRVPEKERSVAAQLAYTRMAAARSSLKEFKEVADRTEGKAPQSIDVTSQGKQLTGYSDEQITRIARRVTERHQSVSGTSSEE